MKTYCAINYDCANLILRHFPVSLCLCVRYLSSFSNIYMERKTPDPNCPGCAELRKVVAALTERVEALEGALSKARKDSSTSSKPPSSDIVRPPKKGKKKGKKRKRGGQPGHAKHERPPFPSEQVTDAYDYTLDSCPNCGGDLEPAKAAPRILQ